MLLVSCILFKIEERHNIRMPRFQVYGHNSRSFVSSLIYVSSGVIINSQHWNNTIGCTIGPGDIASTGTNITN
ncbi:hypothetical protein pCPXV0193 [Cowpox virus]|uniref:Uncharacterized protein n=1 Tax=Cowpox virus TaxID=10243 RepID=A0A212Q3H6_COWPX|nr:hypothetical protein pCPXV0193 [Cowpox virus]SNB53917.1 hypothetical protein pCPXV0193 [Cowpox virus]